MVPIRKGLSQAVAPPSCSILTGPELPQARKKKKKKNTKSHAGSLLSCLTLCDSVDCGLQASLPGKRFSRQKLYISYYPSCQDSEYLVLPEPLRPKQLHQLHTWPSQGQTQVLHGSLRSKPQWRTHIQKWK